jgi:hypothetical protein
MNLGQTMITMGMFVLLVMSVISANRMLIQNAESGLQTEALTESATIANDLFSEAQSKQFDHLVDEITWPNGNQPQGTFSLPTESGWGPLSAFALPDSTYYGHPPRSATAPAYNSIEAYNGYTRFVDADTLNGIRIGGYILTVRVFYVDPNNPDVAVGTQTFFKRIEVDVQHHPYLDFLPDQKLTYSSLMSY